MSMDTEIEALAASQAGVVARRQLLQKGLRRNQIDLWLRSRRLRPIHRGVYRMGPLSTDLTAVHAAILRGGDNAVISHTTSLWLWGLRAHHPEEPIHVSTLSHLRNTATKVVFHRTRELAAGEWATVRGIPVTTIPRTLVDAAGAFSSSDLGLMMATAQREGLLTVRDMDALQQRYARRAGMGAVRAILKAEAVTGFTRSEAEQRCLRLIRDAGLPLPHTNVRLGPYEVDMFWPDLRLVLEVDGYAVHGRRSAFHSDRRRDLHLAAMGYSASRVTWAQITKTPIRAAADLARIIERKTFELETRTTAGRA